MSERCPYCKKMIDYSLIQASPHPDSEGCCYECLPTDAQKAYDKFFGRTIPMSEPVGVSEGDVCNRDGCEGVMWLPPVKDCSCHIIPPCPQCENNTVVCKECGADPDEYVSPRELPDDTRIG